VIVWDGNGDSRILHVWFPKFTNTFTSSSLQQKEEYPSLFLLLVLSKKKLKFWCD